MTVARIFLKTFILKDNEERTSEFEQFEIGYAENLENTPRSILDEVGSGELNKVNKTLVEQVKEEMGNTNEGKERAKELYINYKDIFGTKESPALKNDLARWKLSSKSRSKR